MSILAKNLVEHSPPFLLFFTVTEKLLHQ